MSTNLSCVHNLIQSASSAPTTKSGWAASNTNIVDFGLTETANAFYVQAKSDNTDQFIVYNVPATPSRRLRMGNPTGPHTKPKTLTSTGCLPWAPLLSHAADYG